MGNGAYAGHHTGRHDSPDRKKRDAKRDTVQNRRGHGSSAP